MALVHVSKLHGIAEGHSACIGLLLTHHHAEHRGLTRAVGPDDAHNASRRQGEADVLEKHTVAKGLRDFIELDHLVAEALAVGDEDLQLGFLLLHGLALHLFVVLQAGFALGAARLGIAAHPFQFLLQDAVALALALFLQGEAGSLLLQPVGVVALVGNAFAAVQFEDPARHVIKEITIVGDGDHGAFVLGEVVFQPSHAFGVQVVGGFVQQQDVRSLQQ